MKTDAKRTKPLPEMPFQVDHKLNVDIPTQVTDGIRTAILSGFYKPGDFLPKATEFTRGLHVSLRAPLAPRSITARRYCYRATPTVPPSTIRSTAHVRATTTTLP